jgi:hypothetical protein
MCMKKMLNMLDYVFYRSYRFFCSYRIFRGMEEIDAISVILYSIGIPLACLCGDVCYFTNINTYIEKYSAEYYLCILGIFVLGYLPLIRYMYSKSITKGKYRVFRECWENEDSKQRKKRGWLIVTMIVNNWIALPIISRRLMHLIFD